jgi:hypothetical protein
MTEVDELVGRRRRGRKGGQPSLGRRREHPFPGTPVFNRLLHNQTEGQQGSEHRVKARGGRLFGVDRVSGHQIGPITGSVRSLTSDSSPCRSRRLRFYHSDSSMTVHPSAFRSCPNPAHPKRSVVGTSSRWSVVTSADQLPRKRPIARLEPHDEQTQRSRSQAGREVGHREADRRRNLARFGQPDRLP